jgi:hypothetical protein
MKNYLAGLAAVAAEAALAAVISASFFFCSNSF